jgi:3-hydroxyacyl-CoA dehydrogenase
LLAALVDEAARALADGVAARPGDVDLVLVHGYGFPARRGGPLFAADRLGLARVLAEAEAMARASGEGAAPAPLLVELARKGSTFAAWGDARVS